MPLSYGSPEKVLRLCTGPGNRRRSRDLGLIADLANQKSTPNYSFSPDTERQLSLSPSSPVPQSTGPGRTGRRSRQICVRLLRGYPYPYLSPRNGNLAARLPFYRGVERFLARVRQRITARFGKSGFWGMGDQGGFTFLEALADGFIECGRSVLFPLRV